jgi:3-hydroxyisobutyrate dehydrogenase
MKTENIGWIGTGIMGGAMCLHLLKAGHGVHVYNRTKEKTDRLTAQGAIWCESPAEVAENCSRVFTMVGYPADVRNVILGPDGVLASMTTGSILVDMTTSEPSLAREIFARAGQQKISALDAPVSGGDIGAREGKLAIMAGGERETFDACQPIFEIFGETIAYMGEAGAGQHTKMSNQIMIASTMAGVVESLLYAAKSGLDMDAVIDIIGKGAAAAFSLNVLGRKIAAGDFNPGFFIKHFVKDMGIALDEAKRMNLMLPSLSLVHQFYLGATALGYENLGTQGLYKVLAGLNKMEN